MNNSFENQHREDAWWIRTFPLTLIAFIQIIVSYSTRNPSIDDVFHLGEFVAAAMSVLYDPHGSSPPFTIHGALNIWPYLLLNGLGLGGASMISHAVIIIYVFIRIAVVLLSLLTALRLVKLFNIDPIAMIPFMLFVGGFALGHKELFLLLTFIMLSYTVSVACKGGLNAVIFFVLFGLIAAGGVYWSYDRGLAIIACIGLPLLILAFQYHIAFVAVGSFFVSFLTLPLLLPGIGVVHYFENIILLIRTSENWQYPETDWDLLSGVIVINFLAVLTGGYLIFRERHISQKTIIVLALCLASILFYKIGTNRLDFGHIISAIWVPMLIFGIATRKTDSWRNLNYLVVGTLVFVLVFAAAQRSGVILPGPSGEDRWDIATTSIFLLFISSAFGALTAYKNSVIFINVVAVSHVLIATVSAFILGSFLVLGVRTLQSPVLMSGIVNLPPDIELVNDGIVWLVEEINESDTDCVFDFANMGIINGLTRLPACTRFTYPVYGGAADEATMLAQLKAASPPVVLYSSEFWSYAIDGKPMRERFPQIEAFMLESYPEEKCNYGHCLRYRPN